MRTPSEQRTLIVGPDYAPGRAAWARRNAMRGSLLIRHLCLILAGVVIGVVVGQRAPLAGAVLFAALLLPTVVALIVQPARIAAAVRRRYPVGTVLRSETTEAGLAIIEPGVRGFMPWHDLVEARPDGDVVVLRTRRGRPIVVAAGLLPSLQVMRGLIEKGEASGRGDGSGEDPGAVPSEAPVAGDPGVLSRRVELTVEEARRAARDAVGPLLRTRTQLMIQLLPGGALLLISAAVLLGLAVARDALDLPFAAGAALAGIIFLIALPLAVHRTVGRECARILGAGTVGVDAGDHELRLIYPRREAVVPWSALRLVRRNGAAVIALRRAGGGHPLPGSLLTDADLEVLQTRIAAASARP